MAQSDLLLAAGRVALVTGASSGIGEATTKELHELGYTVYGAARRTDRLQKLVAAGIKPLAMDVTDDGTPNRRGLAGTVNTPMTRAFLEGHARGSLGSNPNEPRQGAEDVDFRRIPLRAE